MKEKISALLDSKLKDLNVFVSAVQIVEDEGVRSFEIELDSKEVIDLDKVTKATEIINPLLEQAKVIDESIDVVDIYGKSKGEVENER